jgi:DNA polymerase-1
MIFRPDLVLIDGSSYIYRAFHALPPLTTTKGKPTGATRGFASMLRKLISTYPNVPMVMIFDAKGPNFRNDFYKEYKANRPPMPNELRVQIDDIKKLSNLFNFETIEMSGVEADDVIATLAERLGKDNKILISSPDKDLTQLVSKSVIQHNSMTNDFFDISAVTEKFGVKPEKISQLLSLVGDKSDNIPGITKVGVKTASKWLNEYQSLDGIIENIENIKGVVGENLRNEQNFLKRNHFLVSLKSDLEIDLPLKDIKIPEENNDDIQNFYKELEFNSFLQNIEKDQISTKYKTIKNLDDLKIVENLVDSSKFFAFDVETSSLNMNEKNLVGISFSAKKYEGFYIPLNHNESGNIQEDKVILWLKNLLTRNQDKIIGHNLKFDIGVLQNYDIHITRFHSDTMLMSYIVNSTAARHNLDALSEHYLSRKTIKFEDVIGKGPKKLKNFSEVTIKDATNYACEDVDITIHLYEVLSSKVDEILNKLLEQIEYPLVFVLLDMEKRGALIDASHLKKLSDKFGKELLDLVTSIHKDSGVVFNLDSPKQLSEVLFEKMNIPTKGLKKTSSGYYSTSESILQKLSNENDVVKDILKYRSLAKLKSTYTDKIVEICDQNSKVHTSYHQAVTSTGRLSSSDPNLQNIPIRTEEGITIREAFVAPKGKKILAIDYSQIELRLMAHYSQDPLMLESFNNNEDIHKRTASEIFGKNIEEIDSDMRRKAKTINFGLLYGMSAFGLANQLSVTRPEAETFLQSYFTKYSRVKEFMGEIVELAKKNKFVTTIYGRKIHVPNIDSPNYMIRQASERAAINGPLQGTAADIIKVAMVSLDKHLKKSELEINSILQVHDELVFEVPESLTESDLIDVIDLMENTTKIDVPLKVELGFGANWRAAH